MNVSAAILSIAVAAGAGWAVRALDDSVQPDFLARQMALQPGADAYLIAVSDEVRPEIFRMAEKFRADGIRAEMDYERRSLKAQMRSANKFRARYAIVVGPDELAAGKLKLKQMATGEEQHLSLEEVADLLLGMA